MQLLGEHTTVINVKFEPAGMTSVFNMEAIYVVLSTFYASP